MADAKPNGIKQRDITPCCSCGKGVAHSNQLTAYRVRLTHLAMNVGAVRRQTGLEMMLGGAAGLAAVMGPDEDILVPLAAESTWLVCQQCAMDRPLAQIVEIADRRDRERAEAEAVGAA